MGICLGQDGTFHLCDACEKSWATNVPGLGSTDGLTNPRPLSNPQEFLLGA